MEHTRVSAVVGLLAAFLVFVEPVAAQSINKSLTSGLNNRLLWVGVAIAVLVEAILVYTVYRYKNTGDPKPTQENRRLEITWTIATAIVLLFVGVAAYAVLANPYIALTTANVGYDNASAPPTAEVNNTSYADSAIAPPADANATQVDVLGYQWGWTFTYPDANVTSQNEIVIPANQDVYLQIHSENVLHAVHVPALGIKQDAFPGQYHTVLTNVTETGSYQLYCAEYCGAGHSNMLANFTVMSQSNYQDWLTEQQNGSSGAASAGSAGNASAGANTTQARLAAPTR